MNAVDIEKLRSIISRGLSSGLGKADGQVCIEGAIALASGEGLMDTPSCVAAEDRAYAIRINDARWPSPNARAEALLPLAVQSLMQARLELAEVSDRCALLEATRDRVAEAMQRSGVRS